MPGGRIKAVIFDLGGTLVSFDRIRMLKATWEGARSSYDYLCATGLRPGPYLLYAWTSTLRLRWQLLMTAITGRDFDVIELFKRVGRKKGIDLSPSQWEQLAWAWYQPLLRIARSEPDLPRTLKVLSEMGLRLGLLSNTFIPAFCLDRHLEQLGILEYLPIRLYSYQFPFRKPDSRIFKEAARRISLGFEQIMFVGDRLDWDIRPAIRLGMYAAWITDKLVHSRIPQGAFVIRALAELPELVQKVNAV